VAGIIKVRRFFGEYPQFPLPGWVGSLIFEAGSGSGRRQDMAALFRREGAMLMKHTIDEIKAKIHEMYPKIDKHGVAATVTYDKAKKTYVLELKKGPHHLATYIDKADADKCMEGVECVHLGVQIGQFLENFKKV
jgi:hypothetical protein